MTYNVFYTERLSPEYILQNAVIEAGLKWDSRKAGEVLRDLKRRGGKASPNFTPLKTSKYLTHLDILPLGGHSFSTIVLCNEFGSWETYESDRFGFNNNDSIHDNPRMKVALIGDSYVQGYCMPRAKTIGGQLNRNGIPTINFGMSGNGFLSYLATFMEYIRPLKIETTVLVWFYNDLDDTTRENQYPNLRYYLENKTIKSLKSKQNQIDSTLDKLISLNPYQSKKKHSDSKPFKDEDINWQSYIRGLITLSGIRSTMQSALGIGYSSTKDTKWDNKTMTTFSIMKNALDQIAQEAESWGGQVIVIPLPPYGGITPQFALQISEMKKSILGKNNLVFSDFEPVYKKYGEEKLYALALNGTHFNEYGYCLFAKHIAEILRNHERQKTSYPEFNDCQETHRSTLHD